jgi:hypothetical protein
MLVEETIQMLENARTFILKEWTMITDDNALKVKQFGILNEYLFKQEREYLEKIYNADNTKFIGSTNVEEKGSGGSYVINKGPSLNDPEVVQKSGGKDDEYRRILAVRLIQKIFRKYLVRKKEQNEAIKNLAETENIDAKEKLRKRRLERLLHRSVIQEGDPSRG